MIEAVRYRRLAAELYRPVRVRVAIVGEAPPPEKFFYFGDSLFFRYLRAAFARPLPEVERWGEGWFLALYREIGGWRGDVCEESRRATKGGADDVTDCLEAFERRWAALDVDPEAVIVISPKRLVPTLPAWLRDRVTASVPPPGQWNAHREAFLRDVSALLERHVGRDGLREAARRVSEEDAALDFEIARACAEGAGDAELRRLLRGHAREAGLVAAWEGEAA